MINARAAAVLLLAPFAASAAAPAPAPAPGRGERALRSSFYLNAVPTMVEMVGSLRKDVLDALELDKKARATVEKALDAHWNEKRLYALSAVALEKQLAADAIDKASAQMTPEIQKMIKDSTAEPTPEEAKQWLDAANKAPDVKERQKLAARISVHMPQPETFKELVMQVAELLADAAQVTTGSDDNRPMLTASLMEGLNPALQAMADKNLMATSAFIAYRDASTPNLKALADALDSEDGKKLQLAAPQSLIAGAKQARQDFVAQLKKELKPAKKK